MSSFLDSTGLSRLVSKITDYFAKKDGNYPNMTVGNVSNVVPIEKLPTASSVTNGDTTHVPTGDAVAKAVAQSYVSTAFNSTDNALTFKIIELTLDQGTNSLDGVYFVNSGVASGNAFFSINITYTKSTHTVGSVKAVLWWMEENMSSANLAYSVDASTDILTIYIKVLGAWRIGKVRVLYANCEGLPRFDALKMYYSTLATLPSSAAEFTFLLSRDASWINSGTFDAARIPTSLPNVTVGTASSLSGYLKRYVSHGYMGQMKKAFRIFVFGLNDYTGTGNTDETFYPEIHFVRSAQEDIVTKLRIRVRNLNNAYTCTASVISRSEQLPAGYSIVLKFSKFDTSIGYYLSIVNTTGDYWCGYVAYMDAPIDHTGNIGSAVVTTHTNPAGTDNPAGQYTVTIS